MNVASDEEAETAANDATLASVTPTTTASEEMEPATETTGDLTVQNDDFGDFAAATPSDNVVDAKDEQTGLESDSDLNPKTSEEINDIPKMKTLENSNQHWRIMVVIL